MFPTTPKAGTSLSSKALFGPGSGARRSSEEGGPCVGVAFDSAPGFLGVEAAKQREEQTGRRSHHLCGRPRVRRDPRQRKLIARSEQCPACIHVCCDEADLPATLYRRSPCLGLSARRPSRSSMPSAATSGASSYRSVTAKAASAHMRHGIEEHFGAGMKPCLSAIRVIGRPALWYGTRVTVHVCSGRHDLSRRSVSTTDVAHQMSKGPTRACGNRRFRLGGERHLSEHAILLDQGGCRVHFLYEEFSGRSWCAWRASGARR